MIGVLCVPGMRSMVGAGPANFALSGRRMSGVMMVVVCAHGFSGSNPPSALGRARGKTICQSVFYSYELYMISAYACCAFWWGFPPAPAGRIACFASSACPIG
jgi:hypothetical protein